MKINRTSWHYKFICDLWQMDEPNTLCQYFWTLMGTFFLTPIAIVFFIVIAPFIPFMLGYEWLKEKYMRRKYGHIDKEPGIFISYYRAWKNKVCPLIEYVNPVYKDPLEKEDMEQKDETS